MAFRPVSAQVDFGALERELLDWWCKEGVIEKYLHRNDTSDKKFSFLDGPITANNPMGVHHAWGRTYKDLWQRFYNMHRFRQRFQNGFDEQGLWVEVEVEKELGLKSKKDIENLVPGDKVASLEKFIALCKQRVKKFSSIQTEQSKRLGYFMDWDNSYHTSSDENNYWIWHFLKVVHEKGWIYKGHDSVPWCPRCGTAISQHEILTEDYRQLTHTSIYFQLPVKGPKNTYLLVWTTTPWTIAANVAVAVDPQLEYVEVDHEGAVYIVAKGALEKVFGDGGQVRVVGEYKGAELVGWEYEGPFDDLPAVKEAFGQYRHRVVATDLLILPISTQEGTGLVHIAPGAGAEDFQLGKKENLPTVAPIDESAVYVGGFGQLSGLGVTEAIPKIVEDLKKGGFLFQVEQYSHRYPVCWRCKSELVWRVVDEWYIAMDKSDESGKTYRQQMVEVAKEINWIPSWGLDRELDWLKNMHDWLISKKRYWGLALPIWECKSCGSFEVMGGKEELEEKAQEGLEEFRGKSPHKPWIDEVKIKCPKCGELAGRIPDVGNPWLDAGIVPFSTMSEEWFPADFVTEAFPGQFKNWFYSLIAMSTALKRTNPFKNLLGHALVIDEKGEPMHKSSKNFIPFDEGVEKMGADTMRWAYCLQDPAGNIPLTYGMGSEIKRRFLLILWNSYKFFVEYANLSDWKRSTTGPETQEGLKVLDRWILARLAEVVLLTNSSLEKFDAAAPARAIEDFVVNDLSTWYIRRSRDRVGPASNKGDEAVFLSTLYQVLVTLVTLTAPFMPFICEEIFRNLTGEESVHLQDYPLSDKALLDGELVSGMVKVRKLVEIGHAQRKEANIKLRQPLPSFTYRLSEKLSTDLEQIMADELNVKKIEYIKISSEKEFQGEVDTNITPDLKAEGETRELIRQIQQLRKQQGLTLSDKIDVKSPYVPQGARLLGLALDETNSLQITHSDKLEIQAVR